MVPQPARHLDLVGFAQADEIGARGARDAHWEPLSPAESAGGMCRSGLVLICGLLALPIAVVDFGLSGWDLIKFAVQSLAVEPLDVGEGFDLEVLGLPPRTTSSDEFVLCKGRSSTR